MPAHAPASVGTLTLNLIDGHVKFLAAPNLTITRNGKPFDQGELRSDDGGQAGHAGRGDVKLILIKRGNRLAIRLKDNQSPIRANFAGLRWFPIHKDWRIQAKFVPYPTATKLVMDTIVGEPEERRVLGT